MKRIGMWLVSLTVVAVLVITGTVIGVRAMNGGGGAYVAPGHNQNIAIGTLPEGGGYQELGGEFEIITPTPER